MPNHKLTAVDAANFLPQGVPALVSQIMFGLLLAVAMIGLRALIDVVAPTSGPFALVYPTVLIATLFGRLYAGIVCLIVSFLWAWYVVLPFNWSFAFEQDTDPARVTINMLSCVVVLALAEIFRKAVRIREAELHESLERRRWLMAELQHRTKNNFALVASMIELQKRRQDNPAAAAALEDAANRVFSFSRAYAQLAVDGADRKEGAIDMASYLEDVIDHLVHASFDENVTVNRRIAAIPLPRDQAVAIGLFLNEALTNAAKYAFGDGRKGELTITLDGTASDWRLDVRDNGAGDAATSDSDGGLGRSLMRTFAQQAGAEQDIEVNDQGCRVTLTRLPLNTQRA
ncbi:sensor histidine kinase [Citromicrobium bathyomarinum]|uniref:sensor histidine kinase n=1 Tax=Citromicrobium bathyomarinum TaxID=72174 RepID=UPI00315A85D3